VGQLIKDTLVGPAAPADTHSTQALGSGGGGAAAAADGVGAGPAEGGSAATAINPDLSKMLPADEVMVYGGKGGLNVGLHNETGCLSAAAVHNRLWVAFKQSLQSPTVTCMSTHTVSSAVTAGLFTEASCTSWLQKDGCQVQQHLCCP
jgi:hypothetical protein